MDAANTKKRTTKDKKEHTRKNEWAEHEKIVTVNNAVPYNDRVEIENDDKEKENEETKQEGEQWEEDIKNDEKNRSESQDKQDNGAKQKKQSTVSAGEERDDWNKIENYSKGGQKAANTQPDCLTPH